MVATAPGLASCALWARNFDHFAAAGSAAKTQEPA